MRKQEKNDKNQPNKKKPDNDIRKKLKNRMEKLCNEKSMTFICLLEYASAYIIHRYIDRPFLLTMNAVSHTKNLIFACSSFLFCSWVQLLFGDKEGWDLKSSLKEDEERDTIFHLFQSKGHTN